MKIRMTLNKKSLILKNLKIHKNKKINHLNFLNNLMDN